MQLVEMVNNLVVEIFLCTIHFPLFLNVHQSVEIVMQRIITEYSNDILNHFMSITLNCSISNNRCGNARNETIPKFIHKTNNQMAALQRAPTSVYMCWHFRTTPCAWIAFCDVVVTAECAYTA